MFNLFIQKYTKHLNFKLYLDYNGLYFPTLLVHKITLFLRRLSQVPEYYWCLWPMASIFIWEIFELSIS